VTQGFRDLVDDARACLDNLLSAAGLQIVQLTGAICPDKGVFRPGLWMVLRESDAPGSAAMSDSARAKLAGFADQLRARFQLS
jgi:hypothetical protein